MPHPLVDLNLKKSKSHYSQSYLETNDWMPLKELPNERNFLHKCLQIQLNCELVKDFLIFK